MKILLDLLQAINETKDHFEKDILRNGQSFKGVEPLDSRTVTLTQSGDSEKEISFVIKTSSDSPFFKKLTTFLRPFAKEIFWFQRAHPTLSKLCPGQIHNFYLGLVFSLLLH